MTRKVIDAETGKTLVTVEVEGNKVTVVSPKPSKIDKILTMTLQSRFSRKEGDTFIDGSKPVKNGEEGFLSALDDFLNTYGFTLE